MANIKIFNQTRNQVMNTSDFSLCGAFIKSGFEVNHILRSNDGRFYLVDNIVKTHDERKAFVVVIVSNYNIPYGMEDTLVGLA